MKPTTSLLTAKRDMLDFHPRSILLENEEVCELLNRFLKFKETKEITRNCVRQIFLPIVKEIIQKFSPCGLGQTCAWGECLNDYTQDYREAALVTTGTNAWSSVFFSENDSGVVMIQKIATASLLVELTSLVGCESVQNPVDLNHICMPIHIFEHDLHRIDELHERLQKISGELGW